MRIVGLETEYGITDPADPRANPILLSSLLVSGCRAWAGEQTTRWDYGGEDPLMDQRGVRRERTHVIPELLTDAHEFNAKAGSVTLRRRRGSWEDPAHLNAVLTNGARFYVDHAHPEYSGPEVTNARDAVIWDRAGDAIALEAAAAYAEAEGTQVALYKNNVDGKGASYGTHENFLVRRDLDFDVLATRLTSHLVTRQIYTGAGRVGLGMRGERLGFQISQRADYMETEVALETTLRRPIVNSRDEPHAERKFWRRLHIIIGDANTFDVGTFMKIGTTSLVLSAIEADDARLDALVLEDPVPAVWAVSRDLSLRAPLQLADGTAATALEVQRALLEIARDYVTDATDALVIARWESLLERLGRDIFEAAREIEWVAKLQLLGRMRSKYATDGKDAPWDDPRIAAADIVWSQLGTGLAARLAAAGHVERLATDDEVAAAIHAAPSDTRAHLRGAIVATRPEIVDAAGWSTIVLDRDADHGHLEVVHLDDPTSASHPLLDELLRG
jgi:proteasome accessory factor PafA2